MRPTEIARKEFKKTFLGYDPQAVREYLAEVAQVAIELEQALAKAKSETESLRSELGSRYRQEHVISEALLEAQEVAARTKNQAEAEARAIIETAKAESERMLTVARAEADARRAEAEAARQEAERRLHELLRAVNEASSRASAALKAGLEAIGVVKVWLENDILEGTADAEKEEYKAAS